ncbi:unnamed protein product [Rotaria sp. Silwood1]|nr:unnamed protein product [Rotaria sp. Silwood1]
MLYAMILIVFLSTSSISVSSLQCYSCKHFFVVNYLVTSDTVPSFSDCPLINATRCAIIVTWDLNNNDTVLLINNENVLSTKDTLEDSIAVMAYMERVPDQEIPIVAHYLQFVCMSSEKCNSELSLKKILHSLIIKDRFVQELTSLIQTVSPFVPQSAACRELNNFTIECPPTDLDACERCQILVDKWPSVSVELCATCPRTTPNGNLIARSTIFVLNNRTQLDDHVQLDCQLKGCNSVDNINRIYKTSKITFDFGKFFNLSSNKIV